MNLARATEELREAKGDVEWARWLIFPLPTRPDQKARLHAFTVEEARRELRWKRLQECPQPGLCCAVGAARR